MKKAFPFSLVFLLSITAIAYAKYEYGNILMQQKAKEIKQEKQKLVVFPHWVHTMWYKCKACHDDIFIMKKGVNNISMEDIKNGKQCGLCHDGKISFGHEQCEKCHSLWSEESELTLKTDDMTSRLYPSIFTKQLTEGDSKREEKIHDFFDPYKVPYEKFDEVAKRIGAKWDPTNLPKGLPKDKLSIIDWVKLLKEDVIAPKESVLPTSSSPITEGKKENIILFEVLSDFVDSVAFRHKEHTYWLKCSNCHEKIFVSKAGANEVHMRRNSNGEFCGYCHGRVAFPLAECVRCHEYPKSEAMSMIKGDVIKRENPLKGRELVVAKGGLVIEGHVAGKERIEEKKMELETLETHVDTTSPPLITESQVNNKPVSEKVPEDTKAEQMLTEIQIQEEQKKQNDVDLVVEANKPDKVVSPESTPASTSSIIVPENKTEGIQIPPLDKNKEVAAKEIQEATNEINENEGNTNVSESDDAEIITPPNTNADLSISKKEDIVLDSKPKRGFCLLF